MSSDHPLEHSGCQEITQPCTAEHFQFLQVWWTYSHIFQRHQTGQEIWTGLGKPGTGSYTPSRPGPVQALGTVPMLYCLQWWTKLCCWSPTVVPSLQLRPLPYFFMPSPILLLQDPLYSLGLQEVPLSQLFHSISLTSISSCFPGGWLWLLAGWHSWMLRLSSVTGSEALLMLILPLPQVLVELMLRNRVGFGWAKCF